MHGRITNFFSAPAIFQVAASAGDAAAVASAGGGESTCRAGAARGTGAADGAGCGEFRDQLSRRGWKRLGETRLAEQLLLWLMRERDIYIYNMI